MAGGLIGDEAGLLLTLGDYHSELTYFVVVAVVAVSLLLVLLTTRRKEIEYDVFSIGNWERTIYVGVVIAGASALPLSAGYPLPATVVLAAGAAVVALGLYWHRKK